MSRGSSRRFPPGYNASDLQGRFGEDYLRALASAWGIAHGVQDSLDRVGTDMTFTLREQVGQFWYPGVAAQVKTTINLRRHDDHVMYDLDVDTYRELRKPTRPTRLLIVVDVPPHDVLAKMSARRTIMLRGAYWANLAHLPDTDNRSTVAVALPTSHLLTREEMTRMLATEGSSTTPPVPSPSPWSGW